MLDYRKVITQNKKANFEYFIEERLESGIVLTGSEVKSVRAGNVAITDSYAKITETGIFLCNCYIAEYKEAGSLNHSTNRPRKLLLKKKEIKKIIGKVTLRGYTLVGLSIFFNRKNIVKVEVGVSKGKKQHDKRDTIQKREWLKKQARILKDKNIP